MKTPYFTVLLLILVFLLNSCFKKDSAVPMPDRGNVRVDTIAMTSSYQYQIYIRLDSGAVEEFNERTKSDLGFDCSLSGYNIILNTADFMRIADLGVRTLGQSIDTTGVKWKFDKSDGNPDSIATGKWFSIVDGDTVSNGHIWALDLGRDIAGLSLGLRQVVFDSLKNGRYYFRYAPIRGGTVTSAFVDKESSVNYIYYGIRQAGVLPLEPPKATWDLLFTQYTTLLFTSTGAAYPYLVTGVLSNPNGVKVSVDTVHAFSSIDLSLARTLNYSTAKDAIGYDWKVYSFEGSGFYTVRTNLSYVVTDTQGYYYKLRFISFYKAGVKGYPVIETQRL